MQAMSCSTRAGIAAACLLSMVTGAVRAQCADGTPPPCDVPRRAAAARAQPPPPEQRARSFLILPFRNLTRSPEHEWLVEGSVAMLGDVLGQWQEISVVREGRLYPALRRHGLTPGGTPDEQAVRRVAEETGGWTVVSGDVLATGENVRIRARAYDAVTGRDVARAEELVGRDEDITAAFRRLGFSLSGPSDLVRRPDWMSARATTRSLDAYKAYLRGLVLYSNRTDVAAALDAFREAVALDSTFALAHALLAITYGAEVVLFDNPEAMAAFVNPQSEANRAIQRATALSAHLPPWERRLMQAISAVVSSAVHRREGRAGGPVRRRADRRGDGTPGGIGDVRSHHGY